jgi:hypothetical protein
MMTDPKQPLAGTLDIAVATRSGDIHHAVRRPDGTWQAFARVFHPSSALNAAHSVNIALNRLGAGIFATTGTRNVLQRFRPNPAGGWFPPQAITGGIDVDHFAAGAADDGSVIAVVGAPGASRFVSTEIDFDTERFTALAAPREAPDLSSIPIPYVTSLSVDYVIPSLKATVRDRGEPFQLVMTDVTGGLYAVGRLGAPTSPPGAPTYPPFIDVRTVAGDPGFLTGVDICPSGRGWFVGATVDGGGLVFTEWLVNGTWTSFADLKAAASDPGAITDLSISYFDGAFSASANALIHVLVATETGGLYHTTRQSDGTFSPFTDVKAMAGDPGPIASVATDVLPWRAPTP